jgi:hypothetical protein
MKKVGSRQLAAKRKSKNWENRKQKLKIGNAEIGLTAKTPRTPIFCHGGTM